MIRIACTTFSYYQKMKYVNDPVHGKFETREGGMEIEDFLKKAHQLRLDGVEFTNYFFPSTESSYLRKLKRLALSYGLDICMVAVGNNFCIPEKEKREEQIDLVKKWTDIAFELGSPSLRIFAGGPSSQEAVPSGYGEDDMFSWAVDAIRASVKYAEQKGVVLALENHRDFGGTPDKVLKLIQAVDSNWFRHVLDLANYRERIYEDSKKTAPYAVHVHVDATDRSDSRPPSPIDYQKVREILEAAGYNGYVSIEYLGDEDPDVAVPKLANLLQDTFK